MPKKRRRRKHPRRCPCGLNRPYRDCCGRFHRGEAAPETPVELMRSRYAAYAKGEVDYIIETTDPEGEAWEEDEAEWREDIRRFGRDTEFLGVEILDSSIEDDTGQVRFRAKLRAGGRDASFVETSEFVRRDRQWLYSSGEVE